ncbi:hypothetical protein Poli38472_005785 [Pythium oligandrum]|uniref:DnaJ homologue subfamily C GRV2/DNAJC13 N-terminal domain-containing protein n=1 Tax=Pythium oligandrum TaxID=41045 RepID=A0A8K1CR73_PYTOL|nr:hypothetical protein Poli38472_005785 [Pythium oligandrum]|eukprot:TMW68317.1 hypothetical protein Poli38472_005785 [Pythium oligandrum]
MDAKKYVARFMVHKVGNFVVKERVLCFGDQGFCTYDPETQLLTNAWSYKDVEGANVLEGETDFIVFTPRHRIKKTVYRCNFRMEVLVCLMKLWRQCQATTPRKPLRPELQTYTFKALKQHSRDLQSSCIIEVCPDGVYQKDEEGDMMSHIPYTSLVSLDIVCDDHNAIVLNHSDNSSLFLVEKRTELAQAIQRGMKLYGMEINEYRKKTMDAALRNEGDLPLAECLLFQFPVTKVAAPGKPIGKRLLAVSGKYVTEYGEDGAVISSRPLSRVYSVIMFTDFVDTFEIVFVDGVSRMFSSTYREKIVCDLITSCYAVNVWEVEVLTSRIPDSIAMVPRKLIQSEGRPLAKKPTDLNVMDRELRAVQSSVIQQFVSRGSGKNVRTQRRLPLGVDEEMQCLAIELNANTPLSGVAVQPNKPYDKAVFFMIQEIRDLVGRHGPCHAFLNTYLQSVYRLLHAPPAKKELMRIFNEHGDQYLSMISDILQGRDPVIVYWMLKVLCRLLESRSQKAWWRQLFQSNHHFVNAILSLFDVDPKVGRYLSDLPTMMLCEFVLHMVVTSSGKQQAALKPFLDQLSRKYPMLLRILYGFPGLATVDACIGIFSRLKGNAISANPDEDHPEQPKVDHAPPMSLRYGEQLTYGSKILTRNPSRRALSSRYRSVHRSDESTTTINGAKVVVRSPEVLIDQYRVFVETPCGPSQQPIGEYSDVDLLRLRFRCRSVFLQELMSHLVGSFDEVKHVYGVDSHSFTGFLGNSSGQREKSELYLTPRALIGVRGTNGLTQEFEYRHISTIYLVSRREDLFAINVQGQVHYIYADSSHQIVENMRQLAGMIGVYLELEKVEHVPKQSHTLDANGVKPPSVSRRRTRLYEVTKRDGRQGAIRIKKLVALVGGYLHELDSGQSHEKAFSLKELQRITVTTPNKQEDVLSITLDFGNGTRVTYLCGEAHRFLGELIDGANFVDNKWLTIAPSFSKLNPRLTARALLRSDQERSLYLNQDGFYVTSHKSLTQHVERMNAEPITETATMDKVMFSLENMNLNLQDEDFTPEILSRSLSQLSFGGLFQGLLVLLQHASKAPVRTNEVCVILEALRKITDGCCRIADVGEDQLAELVSQLVGVIEASDDSIPILLAIKTMHSLVGKKSTLRENQTIQKKTRAVVFGSDRLLASLVDVLGRNYPICSLAVLDLLWDVMVSTRECTDNNQFNAIVELLGTNYPQLMKLAEQESIVGLAVSATALLNVLLHRLDAEIQARIRDAALRTGTTLKVLYKAFFYPNEAGRDLFARLSSMWIDKHKASKELLQRILPHGFIRMASIGKREPSRPKTSRDAKSKRQRHDKGEWFIKRLRDVLAESRSGYRLAKEQELDSASYDVARIAELVHQAFFLPDLIWHDQSREELRHAMERSIKMVDDNMAFRLTLRPGNSLKGLGPVVWNHEQFSVSYKTIAEVRVGQIYPRVLMERIHDGSIDFDRLAADGLSTGTSSDDLLGSMAGILKNPKQFFDEVYLSWLESHRLYKKRQPKQWGSKTDQGRLTMSDLHESHTGAVDLLLRTLTEMMKRFPEVRSAWSRRVNFLLDVVVGTFDAAELRGIMRLLSIASADAEVSRALQTDTCVTLLVFMATVCHRQPLMQHSIAFVSEVGDVPVMGFGATPDNMSVSSIPLTHLSCGDYRMALKWRMTSSGADSASGPYSTIELKQVIDIQKSRLRSLSVCCCSIHEKYESPDHEWLPVHSVPELRWMELMDHPIDAGSVGLSALETLHNIVKNEPSAVENGACVVPMPIAKHLLSSEKGVAMMSQLLLAISPAVRKVACEVLLSLGPAIARKLYKFGVFFFIFAGLETCTGDDAFVAESKLLRQIHRLQDCPEIREGQSFLVDLIPEAMIGLLDSDGAEEFASVITLKKTDRRALWSPSMKNHLCKVVREHIEEFEEDLRRDVAARYRYVTIPPVKYAELSRDVYCGGHFLSTIVGGDASNLDAIEEPQSVMNGIEEKWLSLQSLPTPTVAGVAHESSTAFQTFGWDAKKFFTPTELRSRFRDLCKQGIAVSTVRTAFDELHGLHVQHAETDNGQSADEIVHWILQAQRRLLDKFSFQFFSFESKALGLLLSLMSRDAATPEKNGVDFQGLSIEVLHRLLLVAPLNIDRLVVQTHFWDTIMDTVEHYSDKDDLKIKETLFSIIHMVLCSEGGPRSLFKKSEESELLQRQVSDTSEDYDDEVALFNEALYQSNGEHQEFPKSRRLCQILDRLLTQFEHRQPWQVQELLFSIVSSMCRSRFLQNELVSSTKVFWRALYLLLRKAEQSKSEKQAFQSSQAETLDKKEQDVIEATFLALRALSIGPNGQSRSRGIDALAAMLPMRFLDCLDQPSGDDFLSVLSSDIREPTCIWDAGTRAELLQLLADHCDENNDDDALSFMESATSYMYDCLNSEPLVGGIYLRILLEKSENDELITPASLYPTTPVEFVEALLIFLDENRDPSLGIYADTLPALECLSLLVDLPVFRDAVVDALEDHADEDEPENVSVSVATLGRYLLPYDRNDKGGMSISSRRSLSSYGFMSKHGKSQELDGLPEGMDAEFGNVDYLNRQENALLILNKICGLDQSLERILAPFCRYTWSLQVIADHLDYEQAYYAISCLAELCDACLVVAEYVDQSGLWVEILGIAIQSRQHVLHEHYLRAEALREPAFEVLYAVLSKDFTIRERMYSGLCRFLPYPMVYQIHLDPAKSMQFFDDNHEKSDLVWNSHWRTEVRRKVDDIICRNRVERTKAKRDSVILDDEDYVELPNNFVAGLYLDMFLARPDPEQLTNPAYNLELLFQEWKEQLNCLMGFDLENPPDFLRELGKDIDRLATAMIHILRAPIELDESIQAAQIPADVVKLVRHCNKHLIAGFPYRCVLRVARRLTQFPQLQSAEFFELLFCRIVAEHPDLPALVKVVRRALEGRAESLENEFISVELFMLRDLSYYSEMVKFLEVMVEKKDAVDAKVLSNMNRILRIIRAEKKAEERESLTNQSFLQRASARWHNFTLTDTFMSRGRQSANGHTDLSSTKRSFDVDREHNPSFREGTFIVDDEREGLIPEPPKSRLMFDGETVQEVPPPPKSFGFVADTGKDDDSVVSEAIRASTIRAAYEPVDSKYHSNKAAQYDQQEEEDAPEPRRASLSNTPAARTSESQAGNSNTTSAALSRMSFLGMFHSSEAGSSRRYSLMDSWRTPTSQTNPLLTSLTISRRGRRATAVMSRRKSQAPRRWFG